MSQACGPKAFTYINLVISHKPTVSWSLCFTTMTIEAHLIKDPRARKIEQPGIATQGGLDSEATLSAFNQHIILLRG